MNLEFIESGPALLVSNTKDVLVIADLHLGIEADLARHGIHFKSRSRQRQQKVISCIRETDPDIVLLLGDVKHSIPQTTRQEYRELPDLLSSLRGLSRLMLMPGNHDIGIERFLDEGELLSKEGALVDGTGYLHGHTYPDVSLQEHLIICGHHHPLVCLRDEVGCSLRAPAYLFAKIEDTCFTRRMASVSSKDEYETADGPYQADPLLISGKKTRAPRREKTVHPLSSSRTSHPVGIVSDLAPYEGMAWPETTEGKEPREHSRSGTRVLFMPAFNELSGFDVLKIARSPTSPLSRCMNRESCEIYLADGTYIGPLSSVEEYESGQAP
jgi:metallophosphoesterase superfamily enzyme